MIEDDLRAMFRAHEGLADPERAVRAALHPGRGTRHWPVVAGAAAAVLVVVAGLATLHHPNKSAEPSTPMQPTTSAAAPAASLDPLGRPILTDADNIAYTKKLVAELVRDLDAGKPEGTQDITKAHIGDLKDYGIADILFGPESQTLYWKVPGTAADVVRQLVADRPSRFRLLERIGTVPVAPTPVVWYAVLGQSTDPRRGVANYQIEAANLPDGSSAVLIAIGAAHIPARPASSFAYDVTAVTLRHAVKVYNEQRQVITSLTLTPSEAVRATAIFNRLDGWVESYHSCPFPEKVNTYTLSFTTPTGPVTVRTDIPCYGTWRVLRDGHPVGPVLQGSRELDRLLEQLSP